MVDKLLNKCPIISQPPNTITVKPFYSCSLHFVGASICWLGLSPLSSEMKCGSVL